MDPAQFAYGQRKEGRLIIQYNTVGNIWIFFVMIFRKARPFVCRVLHIQMTRSS